VALVGKTYELRLLIGSVALEVVAVLVGALFRFVNIDISGIALVAVEIRELEGRTCLLEVINEGGLIRVCDGNLRDGSLLENEEGNIAIETSLAIVVTGGVNSNGGARSIGGNAGFEHGAIDRALGLGTFGVVVAKSLLTLDFGSGGVFDNDLASCYETVNDKVASLAEVETIGGEILDETWVAYPNVALIGETYSLRIGISFVALVVLTSAVELLGVLIGIECPAAVEVGKGERSACGYKIIGEDGINDDVLVFTFLCKCCSAEEASSGKSKELLHFV